LDDSVSPKLPDVDALDALNGRWSRQTTRLALYITTAVIDALSIVLGFAAASLFRDQQWLSPQGVNFVLLALPIYFMFSTSQEVNSVKALRSLSESVRRPLVALAATMFTLLMFTFFSQTGGDISRLAFIAAFACSAAFLLLGRLVLHRYIWSQLNGVVTDELLILDGLSVRSTKGVTVIDAQRLHLAPDLNNPIELSRLAEVAKRFDRIIVACTSDRRQDWAMFLKGSDVGGEIIAPDIDTLGAIDFGHFGANDTLVVSRGPLSLGGRMQKRAFDLAITIPALLFLSPLLLLVALAIKLDSPGPVFFRQPRVGQGNRIFSIVKFRSMSAADSDVNGDKSASTDDQRITRIGKLIRRTSIDELPQLLNVLRGDMSIVGPRPHALGSRAGDQLFWEVNARYWLRHRLKPGITGLAQVRGYRGATDHAQDLEDRLQSDLEYLTGWSLWRDITIFMGTVRVLIHPKAY
jgi:exopolysaccharide biosynthesis polyprenyl glycosylphosphotransferase